MEVKSISSAIKNLEPVVFIKDKKADLSTNSFNSMDNKTIENPSNETSGLNENKINDVVNSMNTFIGSLDRKIQFKIMRDFNNQVVIQVVDKNNDKVIKQIPPEYLLKFEKTLAELTGLITDETV